MSSSIFNAAAADSSRSTVRFAEPFGVAMPARPKLLRRAVSDMGQPIADMFSATGGAHSSATSYHMPSITLDERFLTRRRSSALSTIESLPSRRESRASLESAGSLDGRRGSLTPNQVKRGALGVTIIGVVMGASIVFGMWLSLRFLQPVAAHPLAAIPDVLALKSGDNRQRRRSAHDLL